MNQKVENIYAQIVDFAKEYNAYKVVLFGSRARGDNKEKSDIDIAIFGCERFGELKDKIDNDLWSLLSVDTINMDSSYISEDLKNEIRKDGVVLYEKVR
jgi:predicted nucleotidyltransferase